jgi:hypothetical protein
MQRWEHVRVVGHKGKGRDDYFVWSGADKLPLDGVVDQLGADGWEAVSMVDTRDRIVYLFKRPLDG